MTKKRYCMIAALVFSVASLAHAGEAPIVKLDKTATISSGLDLDFYAFHIQDTPSKQESGVYTATLDLLFGDAGVGGVDLNQILFGVLQKEARGSGWTLVDAVRGAGAFSFNASAGVYKAFVGGDAASVSHIPYHLQIAQVTPVAEPETWALMLLGVGFLVFQVRRRKGGNAAWRSR